MSTMILLLSAVVCGAMADDAQQILERYAESWRGAQEMRLDGEVVLGVWIGERAWHVRLGDEGPAKLTEGEAERFDYGYRTDLETLRKLDSGQWNALTAMGQARASDPIPLMPRMPDGFEWSRDALDRFLRVSFHFWNREWPETVNFDDASGRFVHGGNATVLYYQKGLRSAWYQIKAGMHINPDPKDQANEFSTMVIVTKGEVSAKLDGIEKVLREGTTVFIPAGMTHEFWATDEQYGEAIVIMFGEGA